MTNRHLEDFSNVFIDKNATSVEMKMVETIPLVYELEKGKFISRKPYLQDNPEENDGIVPQTKVAFDKTSVDWKQIDFGKMQQTSFTLTNIGDEDLRITNVELSCECLETSYIKRIVPPGDTLHLDIRFYPDITGAFVRDVFVYGNFLSSPMELSLKGVSVAQ